MTILVTGGRGHVGRSVTRKLLAAGETVRVGTSDPTDTSLSRDAEVVELDLSRPQTLSAALRGVRRVFLYADPSTVDQQIEALELAGVDHVTLLSTRSLTFRDADSNPIARLHVAVERALGQSRLPWSFLRAGTFATNTLQWARLIRSDNTVRAPYPQSHAAAVHEDDIADVATLTLTQQGHAGAAYVMSGPESNTQREQVSLIGKAIGREIEFEEIGPETYRQTLSRWGGGREEVINQLLTYLVTWNERPVPVVDALQQLTGRPGRPYAQWAVDHADDFR
ncbi:NAD(P)H-binding protein [Streptomyces sp. NPDC047917]|uniref:NmrA family NAD(P)-binding protein n=1 Tax=Streptomyces sp. NPDC047917 TaxID=3365491 RepID=UPI00371D763D